MQAIFGLPPKMRVVAEAACKLLPDNAPGTLYLSKSHLAFSSTALMRSKSAAAPQTADGDSSAGSDFCRPLAEVVAMSHTTVSGARALALVFADGTGATVHTFGSGHRDSFAAALAEHGVKHSASLAAHLRCLHAAYAAPQWTGLPADESIKCAYACARHAGGALHTGILAVCQEHLAFVPQQADGAAGSGTKVSCVLRYRHVQHVQLCKALGGGMPSVRVMCGDPPHSLEVCRRPFLS